MKGFAKTYKCVNCNKVINPMRNHFCPYCNHEQPLEDRANALGDTIVDIKCPKCGFDKSFYRSSEYLDTTYCPKCGETTYCNEEGKKQLPQYKTVPVIKCPYCNSTDTKKITTASKVSRVALFGVFAAHKVVKQWHCNTCKSDF
jgi:DNA-directed RNA polymerase subunit RPC12/RpoP